MGSVELVENYLIWDGKFIMRPNLLGMQRSKRKIGFPDDIFFVYTEHRLVSSTLNGRCICVCLTVDHRPYSIHTGGPLHTIIFLWSFQGFSSSYAQSWLSCTQKKQKKKEQKGKPSGYKFVRSTYRTTPKENQCKEHFHGSLPFRNNRAEWLFFSLSLFVTYDEWFSAVENEYLLQGIPIVGPTRVLFNNLQAVSLCICER